MSVIDIIFRVDSICQKYDKYDIDKQRELNAYGDDAFARLYAAVENNIQAALSVKFYLLDFLILFNFCSSNYCWLVENGVLRIFRFCIFRLEKCQWDNKLCISPVYKIWTIRFNAEIGTCF